MRDWADVAKRAARLHAAGLWKRAGVVDRLEDQGDEARGQKEAANS